MAAKFFTGLPLDGPDPECVRGHGEAALAAAGGGLPRPPAITPTGSRGRPLGRAVGRRPRTTAAGSRTASTRPTAPATRARWPAAMS